MSGRATDIPAQRVAVQCWPEFAAPDQLHVIVTSENGARQALALTPDAARDLVRLLDGVLAPEVVASGFAGDAAGGL